MPGFTTHYILGLKAYGGLENSGLKYIISKYRWLYQLGLQGPDMFFYSDTEAQGLQKCRLIYA